MQLFVGLALAAMLAGCSKPAPKTEDVRPVRAMKIAASPVDAVAEFPGEVRPRVESRLGFRVGGKIVARKVDVGALVKRGQVLMQLDPQDLQLAQAQANAALRSARKQPRSWPGRNWTVTRNCARRISSARLCWMAKILPSRLRKPRGNRHRPPTATSPTWLPTPV